MGDPRIAVVGLGYVGLPLSIALARHFETVGFDIEPGRIAELRDAFDRTREMTQAELRSSALRVTDDAADCAGMDVYIVTVPTPVDARPSTGPHRGSRSDQDDRRVDRPGQAADDHL